MGNRVSKPEPVTAYRAELERCQKELFRHCALAIGKYLQQRGSLSHPISKLELWELEGMAVDCIGAYNEARERLRKEMNLKMSEVGLMDA